MIVLADTSAWVDHWRRGNTTLAALLEADRVVIHPFVVGELALGALHPRSATLVDLQTLRTTRMAEHDEVLGLVERRNLAGTGIGWVDAHLLTAALLDGVKLLTLDRPLAAAAARVGVGFAA